MVRTPSAMLKGARFTQLVDYAYRGSCDGVLRNDGVAEAYKAINLEVIVFLFSMFTFVTALDVSGVLEDIAANLFLRAMKPEDIIYLTFF